MSYNRSPPIGSVYKLNGDPFLDLFFVTKIL